MKKNVQTSTNIPTSADKVAERTAEAQGVGVKDRLGAWASGQVQGVPDEREEQKAARLAEIQGGAGIKDRQAAYTSNTNPTLNKSLVEERLAEVKGVPGVKDRLGNWNETSHAAPVVPGVAERVAEVKGAPGVKDRLGAWNSVVAGANQTASDPSKVEERLADLGNTGVKDRVGGWTNKGETVSIVASTADPNLAEARVQELKQASSVKERLGQYQKVATDDKVVERAPIYIPQDASELPTKESQGQAKS